MRFTTACFNISDGSASRCTAVEEAESNCVDGICAPSSRVSGNIACRIRWLFPKKKTKRFKYMQNEQSECNEKHTSLN